jgi:release factor glutamine methyltransferase
MDLLELRKHFKNELSEIYTESESGTLFDIFVEKVIGLNKFYQRKFLFQKLLLSHIEDFEVLIADLKTGKPYQQIIGEAEFYGETFFVNEHVLIPRPETEELVEIAIEKIQEARTKSQEIENFKIIDIGTGSGIIPIILKKHFPKTEVFGLDVSKEAIDLAKQNAENLKIDVEFLKKDYLKDDMEGEFDVIISNPPYIGKSEFSEIEDGVKSFEPNLALFSPTENALEFYIKIGKDCKKHLKTGGFLFLEINQKLGKETLELFDEGFSEIELVKDLSGNDRFVVGKKS